MRWCVGGDRSGADDIGEVGMERRERAVGRPCGPIRQVSAVSVACTVMHGSMARPGPCGRPHSCTGIGWPGCASQASEARADVRRFTSARDGYQRATRRRSPASLL